MCTDLLETKSSSPLAGSSSATTWHIGNTSTGMLLFVALSGGCTCSDKTMK